MESRLGKRSARLSVAAEPATEGNERLKRVRWAAEAETGPAAPQKSAASRPTAAERVAAQSIIAAMQTANVTPPLLKKNSSRSMSSSSVTARPSQTLAWLGRLT